MTLVNQATKRPTRKKMFQDIAAASVALSAFVINAIYGVQLPAGVESLVTGAIGGAIGYYVRERVAG